MIARDTNGTSLLVELQPIATEFKSNPGFREASARKLLPYLVSGMTPEQVTNLLGQPTEKGHNGLLWRYSVFYSKTIDVYFDAQGGVEKVVPVGVEADK